MNNIKDVVNSVILDPQYADVLTIVKAARNGAVYGAKVRFPHALVLRSKLGLILKATRQHARNLAYFATLYKTVMLLQRRLSSSGKASPSHSFIAGLLGGYAVFGRGIQSSVNQQISIYVFARVVLALAKMTFSNPGSAGAGSTSSTVTVGGDSGLAGFVTRHSWPAFASLSWAFVMWIFHDDPNNLQPSLRSSMKYIYVNSDTWTGFKNFLIYNQ
ncbi:MAG: hypothetical protein M1837_003942 [Sclerophora amabilis]|nr:MAG: hypothetical protein M1837_003942 [Sclerophora amabilis]